MWCLMGLVPGRSALEFFPFLEIKIHLRGPLRPAHPLANAIVIALAELETQCVLQARTRLRGAESLR